MLTFGSLFSGIGGIDLGFERAGMRCRWQVEIDKYASQVLAKHWPDVPRWDDIRTFPPPEGDWNVDLICGGFPCQDISRAGKKVGIYGERTGLFLELLRVVGRLHPRYVFLENVATLRTGRLGPVLSHLASLGFDAEWHCVPSSAVGAPHQRDRIWVFAWSTAAPSQDTGILHEHRRGVLPLDSSSQVMADTYGIGCEGGQRERGLADEKQSADAVGRRGAKGSSSWLHWCSEPAVGRVVDGFPGRVDRLKCLGNAVVPQVAELFGRAIVRFHQGG